MKESLMLFSFYIFVENSQTTLKFGTKCYKLKSWRLTWPNSTNKLLLNFKLTIFRLSNRKVNNQQVKKSGLVKQCLFSSTESPPPPTWASMVEGGGIKRGNLWLGSWGKCTFQRKDRKTGEQPSTILFFKIAYEHNMPERQKITEHWNEKAWQCLASYRGLKMKGLWKRKLGMFFLYRSVYWPTGIHLTCQLCCLHNFLINSPLSTYMISSWVYCTVIVIVYSCATWSRIHECTLYNHVEASEHKILRVLRLEVSAWISWTREGGLVFYQVFLLSPLQKL